MTKIEAIIQRRERATAMQASDERCAQWYCADIPLLLSVVKAAKELTDTTFSNAQKEEWYSLAEAISALNQPESEEP